MSEFVVHSVPGSPFGRSVLATLEEKAASYRVAAVAPGTAKVEPHISRHPFGRVPVLEHGDFVLYETQAILRYIDRVMPSPSLTPADVRAAARMDQAMNINDWYMFQGVGNVIGFQRVIAPTFLGLAPDEAIIEGAKPKARQVFTELSRLLGRQTFFAGEKVSLADLMLVPQIDFFSQMPEWSELVVPHANLVAWHERITARPSLIATTWQRVKAMAQSSPA
jgi:glutathione S-transferase